MYRIRHMTLSQKAICVVVLLLLGVAIGCAPAATPTPVPKATTAPTTAAPKATTAPAATAAPATQAPPKAQGPIKIGLILPLTGQLADIGAAAKRGTEGYLSTVSDVAGRKIELITEDDQADPPTGLTKVRKLVEKDNINVLTGVVHSGVAVGIRDYVHTQGLPWVISVAGSPSLTQDNRSPHIFRTNRAFGQGDAVGAWYAYDKLGYRKVLMIYLDYEAGTSAAAGFKKVFESLGGKVVAEIKPTLGTGDYAPYLSQIMARAGDIDFVWGYVVGADGIRFVKGYQDFGLKDKVKLFPNGEMFTEAVLPAEGDAAVGHMHYVDAGFIGTQTNPEALQMLKVLKDKYGDMPFGGLEFIGWIAAQSIIEAAKAVNGNVEDRTAFEKALRNVSFKAPNGLTFKFDDYQNAIVPVQIVKNIKQDGKVVPSAVDIIPDVDQFWTPAKLKKGSP